MPNRELSHTYIDICMSASIGIGGYMLLLYKSDT